MDNQLIELLVSMHTNQRIMIEQLSAISEYLGNTEKCEYEVIKHEPERTDK